MNNKLDESLLLSIIGEKLAEARRRRKTVSQFDIADRLGLSRTSVSNIERGKQKAPLSLIYQYCLELGKDIHDILPSTDEVKVDSSKTIVVDGKAHTVTNSVANFVSAVDKKY